MELGCLALGGAGRACTRRSCAQNSEPRFATGLLCPGQLGRGGGRALRRAGANQNRGLRWGAIPPSGPTLMGAGGPAVDQGAVSPSPASGPDPLG